MKMYVDKIKLIFIGTSHKITVHPIDGAQNLLTVFLVEKYDSPSKIRGGVPCMHLTVRLQFKRSEGLGIPFNYNYSYVNSDQKW